MVVAALALAGTAWWVARDGAPEVVRTRAVAVGEAPRGAATGARDLPDRDGRPTRDAAAIDVLRRWDAARAEAYATGSPAALRRLYQGDAGAPDVRLLEGYLRRGYRVEGMCMQLLDVRILRRTPAALTLRVTDRLAHAVAVGRGERIELPRDHAGTRTVRLRRGPDDRWRVAAVRG